MATYGPDNLPLATAAHAVVVKAAEAKLKAEQQATALWKIGGVDNLEVPPRHDPALGTRQALYADEGLSRLIHRYDLAKLFQEQ